MKHFLGVFSADSPDGARVEAIRRLGEEEYRRYVEDVLTVLACRSDYRQFTMVRHAYVEYARVLRHYEEALSGPVPLDEALEDDLVHGLNRRLRGFFAEFRAFLDYTETKLKRRYGRDSEQLRIFKDACARQFDNSFAYRFVYGLRNYALHVNLPLNAVSLASGRGRFDPGDPSTHNRLCVEVDRDVLLHWSKWRRDVRSGLEELSPRFELNPYVDEAMGCPEKIHLELFCAKLPDEKRAAERVLALARSVGRSGTSCVWRVGGQGPIVNGVVLRTERGEVASGENLVPEEVHVGWIPVEIAGAVVGLPNAKELLRYEYLHWQIADAVSRIGDADVPE